MSPQFTDALFEFEDGVARFTMNRPDLLNALTEDMKSDFAALVDHVSGNESIKVLVLRGAGRAFSAGGNVKNMQSVDGAPPTQFRDRVRCMHRWMQPLFNLEP